MALINIRFSGNIRKENNKCKTFEYLCSKKKFMVYNICFRIKVNVLFKAHIILFFRKNLFYNIKIEIPVSD